MSGAGADQAGTCRAGPRLRRGGGGEGVLGGGARRAGRGGGRDQPSTGEAQRPGGRVAHGGRSRRRAGADAVARARARRGGGAGSNCGRARGGRISCACTARRWAGRSSAISCTAQARRAGSRCWRAALRSRHWVSRPRRRCQRGCAVKGWRSARRAAEVEGGPGGRPSSPGPCFSCQTSSRAATWRAPETRSPAPPRCTSARRTVRSPRRPGRCSPLSALAARTG